jgi:hypothetical protein
MARANASAAGHTGLIDNAIGFVSALFAYVETRAALLAVESKTLLLQLVIVVAFGLGALIAVVFGYIFCGGKPGSRDCTSHRCFLDMDRPCHGVTAHRVGGGLRIPGEIEIAWPTLP